MAANWLKAKQTRYAAYATLYIVIFSAVLVVANILADRYNKSYDATHNKQFTLSEQTLKILRGLKNNVNITYFDTPNGFQNARDLLDRYSNASGKVHIQYVDINKNPGIARAAGVTRAGEAFVDVGNKHEEAKSFDEQGVTGALIRDIKGGTRTVCNVEGEGEHRLDEMGNEGFSHLKELLQRDNYQSKSINLLQNAQIPSDCTVVVIGGPSNNMVQPEVDALKNYVQNGGRALIMVDPPLKFGKLETADNEALNMVLEGWGITPQKDLILDLNPVGQVLGLGPQVALVTSYDSHPIVNAMKGTATGFPITRSLEIKPGSTAQKLFSSSDNSYATKDLSSPQVKLDTKTDLKGPLAIAAAGTYSTGKENSQGRYVVIGSSGWAANNFIGFNGNRDLFLNMINWLASDEDLISIRPKEAEDRRVNLTQAQMAWIRTVSQFLLPGIAIIAGVAVWWRRR